MNVLHDLLYALRLLRKHPGFTLVAVITLGLGIGTTATIFSCVNGMYFRSLPYRHEERLVHIAEKDLKRGMPRIPLGYPDFVDWRALNNVFEEMALYQVLERTLTRRGEPEQLQGAGITAGLFSVLGVQPFAGRDFRPEEDRPGGQPVVILSHGLWQRRFGGDTSLVGQFLTLNGTSHAVIGIMPQYVSFPNFAEFWVPAGPTAEGSSRGARSYNVIARLKPGVSRAEAQSQMDAIAIHLAEEYPESNAGVGIVVAALRAELLGDEAVDIAFAALAVAASLVLLIACANVAGLLVARSAGRRREIAVRAALGAGRWRIVRLLLAESLWIALISGAFGLWLGPLGRDALLAILPTTPPAWANFDFDLPVVGFVLLISLLAGAALGILPALQASRTSLSEGLKESGRSAVVAGGRLRSVLVTAEVALALTLLVGAGLMARTFQNLLRTDPGFNPENLLTVRISLPRVRYPDPDRRKGFFRQALAEIRALPGVRDASAVSWLPLTGLSWTQAYSVEGEPPPSPNRYPQADNRVVMPGYFRTMGIPIIRGRTFDDRDGLPDNEPVVIVNESLAQRHWPNDDPIGRRLKYEGPKPAPPWMTVVGVVRDVRQRGLQAQVRIGLYVPMEQSLLSAMTLVIRTDGDPLSLSDAVRAQIAALDPDLPLFSLLSMRTVLRQSLWQTVLASWIMGAFAVMALILTTVGLYGVISYQVSQRTREIGVRIALGADLGRLWRQVIFQGVLLTLIGEAIGLAASIALMRLMSALLFGVRATDPLTIAAVALVLMAAAILASYIPARRACRVDPIAALRCE